MRIVLDSNVLLVSIGKRSRYKPIWQAFVNSRYKLVISEEIIHEYEEILQQYSAPGAAGIIMKILGESPDVIYKRVYYLWNAIKSDPDDNKFFDAAIAGEVDFLVSNDNHFKEAKNISFPKVNIISANEFLDLLSISP